MPGTMMRLLSIGICATAVAALAGCASKGAGDEPPTVTVTVPPHPAATPSVSASGSSAASSASTGPSSRTATATATKIPGTCDSLLADYTVGHELGGLTLAGRTAFVVGVPDTATKRLANINCRYGVIGSGTAAKAKVEIGVSLYRTPADAATRVTATVDDYRAHGGTSSSVAVKTSSDPALTGTYLTGGAGVGYEFPLLVVASGQRTIAVTVDPAAVKSLGADKAAVTLAVLALQRTAA